MSMRRVLSIVAILIALATAAVSAASPQFDSTRLYSEAEFTAAIKADTDSIGRSANDAEAHYWLGVAYLYAYQLSKLGLAPYAGRFGGREVASLERSVQLKPDPAAMLALEHDYILVWADGKWARMVFRLRTDTT